MQIVEISEPGTSEAENEIVVGIDFGTTNSLIAISRDYHAEIIKLQGGAELLPSVINIHGDEIVVGSNNKQTQTTILSIKRLLAKSSEEIKNNPNLRVLSDVLFLEDDIPKLHIGGKKISLPEVATEIFKHLKYQAEKSLQRTLKKAVVSVPAYFNDTARGQVLLAAKLAGLEVIRLIAEPTAAAYAYGLHRAATGSYLVYDFGGGTFDVSILNMHTGVLQVIATGGDNMLGGDDIDMLLADYIAAVTGSKVTSEIISLAKKTKEELSTKQEIRIDKMMISRKQYEKIIDPIIKKTLKIAKDTVQEAEEINLDGIILVGGSTRIPLISSKLKEAFGLPIYSDLDPDKIVALGAAMQAENLSSKSNSLLIDVVPLSVGLELYGGIAEKLIMRNTPIPFSVTKEFTTHTDNQTGMQFHVVQGEREMVKDCRSLAHFELGGMPPMKAGKVRVEITFAMDADGILSVTAYQADTGKTHNVEIKPSYGLGEKEINETLSAAFKHAMQDHEERLLAETRGKADSLISGLQKATFETPDILSKAESIKLKEAINSLQKVINLDNRDKILLEMDKLNKLAGNFIQKHLDQGATLHLKGRHIDMVNNNSN